MLMDIMEGLPVKPHEWPNVASKGYNQYKDSATQNKSTKDAHKHIISHQADAYIDKSRCLIADSWTEHHNQKHTKAIGNIKETKVIVLG